VKEGDIVTMCSATFGDQMWSTRGVGLTRVLAAIRVRAGPRVKLVFESQTQYKKKAASSSKQQQAMKDAREAAQAKKDSLLSELEQDEKKLKKGKFLGLFYFIENIYIHLEMRKHHLDDRIPTKPPACFFSFHFVAFDIFDL
jgi:hypothetical protein